MRFVRFLLILLSLVFAGSTFAQSPVIQPAPYKFLKWVRVGGSLFSDSTILNSDSTNRVATTSWAKRNFAPATGGAYVPSTRQIFNGYGILGGTSLSSNITKSVDTATLSLKYENITNKTSTQSSSTTTYPNWLGVTNAINSFATGAVGVVSTIPELQSYSDQSTSLFVKDEARGGLFDLVTSLSLTADNGVIFAATGKGANMYWIRRLTSDEVYPEWWGSGTYMTSYIQSALDFVANKGLKVKLRSGKYSIDTTLIIRSNSTLELDDHARVALKDSVNLSMIRNANAVFAGSTAVLDSNIIIKGGTWFGNGMKQAFPNSNGIAPVAISLHNITNAYVSNLRIDTARTYAIYTSSIRNSRFDKIKIDNSKTTFNQNRDGIHIVGPAYGNYITNCTLRGTDDVIALTADDVAYPYHTAGDIENTVISGNVMDSTLKGIRILAAINNVKNTTISNTTGVTIGNFLEIGNYGLGPGGKVSGLNVTNNVIRVDQTVTANQGRNPISMGATGYENINFTDNIVGGKSYSNATFLVSNNVTTNNLIIRNFTDAATDTVSHHSFIWQSGGNSSVGELTIDGYRALGKKGNARLISISQLTAGNVNIANSRADTVNNGFYVNNSTFKTLTLHNNSNNSSRSGNYLLSNTIDSIYVSGKAFSQNGTNYIFLLSGNTLGKITAPLVVRNNGNNTANGTNPYIYYNVVSGGVVSKLDGNLPTAANPTASVGLTAVNGSANTYMRSDAAPALSQAIAPNWTNTHTFSNSTYSALFTGGNVGVGTTTPTFSIDISKPTASFRLLSSTATNVAYSQYGNGGGTGYFGLENSAGGGILPGSLPYAFVWTTNSRPLQFGTANVVRMTITNTFTGIGYSADPGTGNLFGVNGNAYINGSVNTNGNSITGKTEATSDNSTKLASTAFVKAQGYGSVGSVSSANTDIAVANGGTTPVLTLNAGPNANQIVKRGTDGSITIPGSANGYWTNSGFNFGRMYLDATDPNGFDFRFYTINNVQYQFNWNGAPGFRNFAFGKFGGPVYLRIDSARTTAPQFRSTIFTADATAKFNSNGDIVAASSADMASPYLNKSANYTVLTSDFGANGELYLHVDCTAGAVTITLPTASAMAPTGKTYKLTVFKTDASANAVNITGVGANINGAATNIINPQWGAVTITSNSTQYLAK